MQPRGYAGLMRSGVKGSGVKRPFVPMHAPAPGILPRSRLPQSSAIPRPDTCPLIVTEHPSLLTSFFVRAPVGCTSDAPLPPCRLATALRGQNLWPTVLQFIALSLPIKKMERRQRARYPVARRVQRRAPARWRVARRVQRRALRAGALGKARPAVCPSNLPCTH